MRVTPAKPRSAPAVFIGDRRSLRNGTASISVKNTEVWFRIDAIDAEVCLKPTIHAKRAR